MAKEIVYYRKPYTRSDGTHVRGSIVHRKSSGRSRGRKTGGPYSKSKGYSKWISREGKLGGEGYMKKSASQRHKLLDKCVKEYGYRSCLGSLMVLNRAKELKKEYGDIIDADKNYLKKKYGGPGSFSKSRSRSRSKRKSRKTSDKSRSKSSSKKKSKKSTRKSSKKRSSSKSRSKKSRK